jgi:hypothetical protein
VRCNKNAPPSPFGYDRLDSESFPKNLPRAFAAKRILLLTGVTPE